MNGDERCFVEAESVAVFAVGDRERLVGSLLGLLGVKVFVGTLLCLLLLDGGVEGVGRDDGRDDGGDDGAVGIAYCWEGREGRVVCNRRCNVVDERVVLVLSDALDRVV